MSSNCLTASIMSSEFVMDEVIDINIIEADIEDELFDPFIMEDSMLRLWPEVADGIFDLDMGLLMVTVPCFSGVAARIVAGVLEFDISLSSRTKVPFLLKFWVQSCSIIYNLNI